METSLESDPDLATATLINGVVCDLLCQTKPNYVRFPELIDLAVIGTGLGLLRSKIALVSKSGIYWDSTQWDTVARPFLGGQGIAYANALAAWGRGDSNPEWTNELHGELRKPFKASLKYLTKTSDSFFNPSPTSPSTIGHSQDKWWKLANGEAVSTQIIAVRQIASENALSDQQVSTLVAKLQSGKPAIVLQAIACVERIQLDHEAIVRELRELVNDRNDQVRSKSMLVLTRLKQIDESTIESAVEMLDSSTKHNVFAGINALASRESIAESHQPPVDRAFRLALKSCDYEFVGLFAAAYNHWMPDDAKTYVQEMLEQHSPEHLQVALDALQPTPENLVSLS